MAGEGRVLGSPEMGEFNVGRRLRRWGPSILGSGLVLGGVVRGGVRIGLRLPGGTGSTPGTRSPVGGLSTQRFIFAAR